MMLNLALPRSAMLVSVAILAAAGPALGATPSLTKARAEVLQTVLDCRKLTDGQQRLACFDAAVTTLDTAAAKGDVIVVDREQIRAVKRQTFGLALPSLAMFTGGAGHPDDVDTHIELALTGVQGGPDGHTLFTFADGSVWRQADQSDSGLERKTGSMATISRGVMGSFFLTVGKIPGVRVQRQR